MKETSELIITRYSIMLKTETEKGLEPFLETFKGNSMLQIYGIEMQGLSDLTKNLIEYASSFNIPHAELDVSNKNYGDNPMAIYEDVIASLRKNCSGIVFKDKYFIFLAKKMKDFNADYKPPEKSFAEVYDEYPRQRLSAIPKWFEDLEGVKVGFVELLNNAINNGAKLDSFALFFTGDTHKIPRETLYFLEDCLIRPLLIESKINTGLFWMGRRPIQWRRPEVRQRIHTEQFNKNLVRTKEDYIKTLNELPDKFIEPFKYLSVCEVFDVNIMEKVLKACDPDKYEGMERGDFKDLLDGMKGEQMIDYKLGFVIDEDFRQAIMVEIRKTEPNNYQRAVEVSVETLGKLVTLFEGYKKNLSDSDSDSLSYYRKLLQLQKQRLLEI